jgi:hypothetical protein
MTMASCERIDTTCACSTLPIESGPGQRALAGMLRAVLTGSEAFSHASVAIATALACDRIVAVGHAPPVADGERSTVTYTRAVFGPDGIALIPAVVPVEGGAAALLPSDGARGHVLLLCDLTGDSDTLLRDALRVSQTGAMTIAITGDQPNLLAAQAACAIRVPTASPIPADAGTIVLRHLLASAVQDEPAGCDRVLEAA